MVYKVESVEREGSGKPWEFEFDGDRYTLPNDFDMRAAAQFSAGDLHGGLEILLGPDQWDQLCKSPKLFGIKQLTGLLNSWCDDIGVDLGEFTAPSRSSRRAVAPSKRTSNGSTGSSSRTSSRGRQG